MPMTTRCPRCGTAFKVVADQLRVRNGLVRCGVCSNIFDGFAAIVGGQEAAAPATPRVAPPDLPPPAPPAAPHVPLEATPRPATPAWQPPVRVERPPNHGYGDPAGDAPPAQSLPSPIDTESLQPRPPTPFTPDPNTRPASRAPYIPPVHQAHPLPRPPERQGEGPYAVRMSDPPIQAPEPAVLRGRGDAHRGADAANGRYGDGDADDRSTPYGDDDADDPAARHDDDDASARAMRHGDEDAGRSLIRRADGGKDDRADQHIFVSEADRERHEYDRSIERSAAAGLYARPGYGDRERDARDDRDDRDDDAGRDAPGGDEPGGRDERRAPIFIDPDERDADFGAVSIPGEARTRYDDSVDAGMAPPQFMDEGVQRRITLVRRLWVLGCLLGLIVLAAQWVFVYRTAIVAAVPALRPAFQAVCAPLGCDVGYARRIERISIVSSSLQPAANASSAATEGAPARLVLAVTLRNRYDKPQPWPALVLQLTDLSDTVVVRKVLRPQDYLPAGAPAAFAAGGEQVLSVPIQVAGAQVNGYQLDKFFP